MQRLEVSGAVRPIYGSLGVKRLTYNHVIPKLIICTRTLISSNQFYNIFNINYKLLSFLKVQRIDANCGKLNQFCLWPNYSNYVHEIPKKFIKLFGLTDFYLTWRQVMNFSRSIRK